MPKQIARTFAWGRAFLFPNARSVRQKEIWMSDAPAAGPKVPESALAEPTVQTSNARTALTDDLRKHFSGDAPLRDKAKSFAKARPWASAAFVGIAAIALLNTLRGRR